MESKKKLIRLQNKLEPRVTHEEYQKIVRSRKLQNRFWGIGFGLTAFICIFAVISGLIVTPLGEFTGKVVTDIITLGVIFVMGVVFGNFAKYCLFRFPCRFCLKNNPEGSTYCMKCGADLLSNETLPEHKKYYDDEDS